MRSIFFLILLTAVSGFTYSFENNTTIILIPDPKENIQECTIGYRENGQLVKIPGVAQNGRYLFSCRISSARKATVSYMVYPDENTNQVKNQDFVIEPGKIQIDMSDGTMQLSGTPFQEAMADFFKLSAKSWSTYFPTDKSIDLEQPGVREKYETYLIEKNTIWEKYYEENKFPMVTAFTLEKYVTPRWVNLVNAENYFNRLSAEIRNLPDIKEFGERLESTLSTGVGKKSPVFSLPDSTGALVHLADLKGKYVLVDFWTHWCKPCREENPALARLYKEYGPEGFSILSVSLDDVTSYNDWKKAVIKDEMGWLNVIDTMGMSHSNIARSMNVNFVPRNFLLDKNGIIIAKNIHGEELDKKIASLITNNK